MEQAELSQLSNTIRSSMGETAGKFRDAAERGNNNLAKILGTVAAAIKAQRQDLAEMQNVLSESESVSERNASTLQSIQAELQDINSGIHDIATGMKNMARGIANVDNSIFRLNQDLQSSIGQSLLPGLLTGLSGTATSIVKGITALAMGGLAFGGAKTAMDYMTGGGAGGMGGDVTGIKASGSLAQNQQEAYKSAIEEGLSEKSAKILVANMSGESLKNPGLKRWDRFHYSQGIVQWDDQRSENIKQHFGKYPQQMTVAEQTKAAIWEMKTHKEYAKAWENMTNERLSDQERMYAVVKHYEKPQFAEKDTQTRLGYLKGLNVSGGQTEKTPDQSVPKSSPMQSQYEQPPVSSEGVSRVEKIGGEHGHGPISGTAEHGHSEHTPISKGVVTGKSLDEVNPTLANAFLAAAAEYKQKTGETVNVNSAKRSTEEQQRLWEKKQRGEIRYPVAQPGTSLHERGLAIDVPEATAEKMDRMGILRNHGLNRPVPGDPVHIQLMNTKFDEKYGHTSQESSTRQETPTAMTPVMPAVSGGITPEQMAMITGGMNPMAMAATTAMMSQLQSAQDEAAAIAPQQQQESQPPQFDQTQILSQLSKPSENAQIVQQAAVAKQAQQELAQQEPITDLLNSIFGQLGGGSSTVVNNSSNMGAGGYNGQYDIGWPDWAEMIGGNHWKEMKSYKKNMWG
jgi:hypothetical protein